MKAAWLTDIHLNFLSPQGGSRFVESMANCDADALLIGGDIAEAPDVGRWLERLSSSFSGDIYFVLGNHDFYFGSIARTRSAMQALCATHANLHYLTTAEKPVALSPQVALVGHDGWADAQYGDYAGSTIMMNDYRLIEELAGYDKASRLPVLRSLASEAALHVRKQLSMALAQFERVVLLTHLPPLREACWYQGGYSDDAWIPHFTCKAIGDAILEAMAAAPKQHLTVLCGHTHSSGVCRPLDNVEILTGAAEYGSPQVQQVLVFD